MWNYQTVRLRRTRLDPDTSVGLCLQSFAGVESCCRVPGVEIGHGDPLGGGDSITGISGLDQVKLVTVAEHSGLNRRRGPNNTVTR